MTKSEAHPVIFFADAMLGKLARWLRILGYDTAYEGVLPDELLIERVLRENRWLLTRDAYLAKRKAVWGRHTLLRSDRFEDQLRQLRQELQMDLMVGPETLSRCAECNLVVERLPREEAVQRVPPFVAGAHSEFTQCTRCRRVFWPGTHWARICAKLEGLRAR